MSDTNGTTQLSEQSNESQLALQVEHLQESLQELEMEMQSDGWRRMTMQANEEFSREGLRDITELSRIMAVKNPLIKRATDVKPFYVWGQGMSVHADDEDIGDVLTAFMDDAKNRAEMTGHQARMDKERELETDGNVFLVLFTNRSTGRVRLRSVPFSEVDDLIRNPDDARETWFYRRRRVTQINDVSSGTISTKTETVYHPDLRHNPTPGQKHQTIGGDPVLWDQPIYHVKVGGFSDWKFGISEVYSALDWAVAYKAFLEDWASIVRAYRRFAFQMTTKGGKRGIAAAKNKLNSTYAQPGAETNPPPVTGSTFIGAEGVSLSSVNHGNATVKAEDGRRLLLMVAATVGLPETFFGDVSVGTLATAKSLDRPTELAMIDRQSLWSSVHYDIFDYVLLWAVRAPSGPLASKGSISHELDDGQDVYTVEWNNGVDPHVDIDFPPVVQESVNDRVDSIVSSSTLDGKSLAGTMDLPTVTRLLLVALGEDDVDEVIERMFPNGEVPEVDNPDSGSDSEEDDSEGGDGESVPEVERMMVEAVRELREALINVG